MREGGRRRCGKELEWRRKEERGGDGGQREEKGGEGKGEEGRETERERE